MKTIKKQIMCIVLSGCILLTTSCATVLRGTTHQFPIVSDIPAKVKITGKNDGQVIEVTAPTRLQLKRKQDYIVEVSAEGYASQTFQIVSKMDLGWLIIGDILIAGGIVGLIVDVVDGAAYTLNPKELNIKFQDQSLYWDHPHSETLVLTTSGRYFIPLTKTK